MRRPDEPLASIKRPGHTANIADILRLRAAQTPGRLAYVFLGDGENESARRSFAELHKRAASIAAQLQARNLAGQRALLLYPPGLEFIEAFCACLYAGVIAVPANPPSRHNLDRLLPLIGDAAPRVLLSTAELRGKLSGLSELSALEWLDTGRPAEEGEWTPIGTAAEDLAFLQYTSGSTGNPKGVMVSHGNLLANQEAIRQSFGHTEDSTVVGWLPFYHDMGLIGNILQPLYVGATSVLMPPMAFLEKPARWLQAISKYRASTAGGPNFAYDLCVRKVAEEQKRGLDLSGWRLAFNGSETVRAATLERFSQSFAGQGFRPESFFPCYGLAEATLFVTGPDSGELSLARPDADAAATVGCGRAWCGQETRIVDPHSLQALGEGQVGEIWVAGPSVAQGYWNRPEESDAVFRVRLAGGAGAAYLRTGDLGFLSQGQLHVAGRLKDLIIVRGRNYYPQDVEQALTERVAALRPEGCAAFSASLDDEECLVVVAEVDRAVLRDKDFAAVFAAMRQVLVESCELAAAELVLVKPGAVPKTSSGKLRRSACRQAYLDGRLDALARAGGPEAVDGRDEGEALSREAWSGLSPAQRSPLLAGFLRSQAARLLQTSPASLPAGASLCALGLDSLKAVELKHAVEGCLGLDVPLTLFLSEFSLQEVADRLAEEWPDAQTLEFELPSKAVAADGALSLTQQGIWAVHQRDPSSPVYNVQTALRIHGPLDRARFERALRALLEKHEILRTVYREEGGTVRQQALPVGAACEYFAVVDAASWSDAQLRQDLARRALAPFDLARGPMARATLYQQGTEDFSLLFCAHHIAVDLWSVMVLLEELRTLYETPDAAQTARVCYGDFVAGQQAYLASPRSEADWAYWSTQLAGELPVLDLPCDFPRPKTPNYRGRSCPLRLAPELAQGLRALAENQGATVFMTLLAAYKVLLHRHTHQDDIIVGVAGSGRAQARFAEVVGNCVNPLALRSQMRGGETFARFLGRERQTVLDALAHQEWPFSALVERLQPDRSRGQWPIFQTLFVFRTEQSGVAQDLASLTLGEAGARVRWGEWMVEPVSLDERGETFDLTVTVAEQDGSFLVSFHYRADLFEQGSIARMAGEFETLLKAIVARPETCLRELPLLTERESRQLLVEWNATSAGYPQDLCLHQLFEAQAAARPEAEALSWAGGRVGYAELNARANRWARRLRTLGVGPEARVGLCVGRAPSLPAGILAILKAGAAYVPVDPDYPAERVEYLLRDSGADALLTESALLGRLPASWAGRTLCLDLEAETAAYAADNLPAAAVPANAAYVIYTSGSTGAPKGVVVSHRNAVHSTYARFGYYPRPAERFLLLSSFAFDSSVAGIFWTLGQGGALVLAGEGVPKDPAALAALAQGERATHLLCLPSLHGLLLEQARPGQLDTLSTVIVAGEACPPEVARRHQAQLPQTALYNEYGPTEATVWASVHAVSATELDGGRPVAIGKPIANARVYLLDAHGGPVPAGVAGEVHIGGEGVARGYLDRPGLTAERFLPDPFGGRGGRLYKTGDLARWRADGLLEFVGRADQQVKIRGHRIEPGEIEARLLEHPGVAEAVVAVREDAPGDKRLVAYATPKPGYAPTVQGHARHLLPNGMAIAQYEAGETDYLYRQIFEERGYLRHGLALADGDCVFDVGANIGLFTLFVNHHCPNACVYAFEPVPAVFERLAANAALYGARTTALPVGLSDVDAEVSFTFYPQSSLMSGRYADRQAERGVVRSYIENREGRDLSAESAGLDALLDGRLQGEELVCPVRRLSSLIREYGVARIDLLKIDVERSEWEVLQGIEDADWGKIRQLVLEVEDTGGRLGQIRTLLEAKGYRVAVEQEDLLRGTAIHNVYARQPDAASPPLPEPARQYPAPLSVDGLRQHLRERLPEPMLPSAYAVLESLPLTPNGKLDRKALPAPDLAAQSAQPYAAPANPVEEQLAAIWKEVLRLETVGAHDNFFELGGDSILSIQVASRAINAGLDVNPAQVFEHPTIAGLAAALAASDPGQAEEAVAATADGGQPTPFSLCRLDAEELASLLDAAEDLEDVYPLTPMQEGMLFHTLMAPGSGIYVMQDNFELHGDIDPVLFGRAWQAVVDRHPALRTAFVWEGCSSPHQVVHQKARLPFNHLDLSGLGAEEQQLRVDALLQKELDEGIDLTAAPLLRIHLIDLGAGRYRMVYTHHHIILDAWCNSPIMLEFKGNYEKLLQGQPLDVEPAPRFGDYMAWLLAQDRAAALEFWRDYLQGFAEPTAIGMEKPVIEAGDSVCDAVEYLSEEDTAALHALAQRHQLTANTFVQAAWALLLGVYSRREEVLFGVTVAGRPAGLPGVETMLGLFINTLPLRVKLDPGQRAVDFVAALLRQNVAVRQYEHPALLEIQGVSELPRGQDLFHTYLVFENAPIDPSLKEKGGAFHYVDLSLRTHTNYPITVMVIPGSAMHLQISYPPHRYEAAAVEQILRHFKSLLRELIDHPERKLGELGLLAEAEARQVVGDWNRTGYDYPPPCDFLARFEAQAAQTPDAVAVACQGERLDYRELDERANRLAHSLRARGVGPDAIVALLNDRGIDFLVMMLGVFKCGAAYLPVDPAHPDARLAQVLRGSRVGLLLAGENYRQRAEAICQTLGPQAPGLHGLADVGAAAGNLPPRHRPENLAVVIFTSGSTGAPKGAMVDFRGMFNNLITKVPTLGLTADDVIAQTAAQCFDISVWQHLTALVCGGRVEIFADEVVRDPARLLKQLRERGVTVLEAVPSMIQALLLEAGEADLPNLRWLIACGEAFPPALCRRWMARFPHTQVLNAYGPAECSDDVSYYRVPEPPAEADTVVPVGQPVDNTRLYLLDRWLNPVPVGVAGEICVAGIQVGRGYLNRPDLTAAAFVPDPFSRSGERLYRTGDLGRYRPDGNIEFLGRIDHQVKIRGFRIELGEVEAQLRSHPRVGQAVVTAHKDESSGNRLVAYVTAAGGDGPALADGDDLRAYLAGRLPSHMVPSAFVALEELPLNANGKVDRKRLPEPDIAAQREGRHVAPRNRTEEILADIWREVLGVNRVGVLDNFFDLGGHSLLAVQVLSRVRAAFGVEVPLNVVFESASLETLGLAIEELLIEELEGLTEQEAEALLAEA